MKREDLKKLGIEEDEVLDKIMTMYGKSIEKHKTDLETAKSELEGVQEQLKQAGETIAGFKEMDIDAIKLSASEWEEKAKTIQQEAEANISKLKFDHALDGALQSAKAKNPKAVKALLNMDILQLQDDGAIAGLEEQLGNLKSEQDYLFESEQPEPKVVTGGKSKTLLSDAAFIAARQAAGLPVDTE